MPPGAVHFLYPLLLRGEGFPGGGRCKSLLAARILICGIPRGTFSIPRGTVPSAPSPQLGEGAGGGRGDNSPYPLAEEGGKGRGRILASPLLRPRREAPRTRRPTPLHLPGPELRTRGRPGLLPRAREKRQCRAVFPRRCLKNKRRGPPKNYGRAFPPAGVVVNAMRSHGPRHLSGRAGTPEGFSG